jgi:macrodomain Ter protein organizer (MatP/YcbG family)
MWTAIWTLLVFVLLLFHCDAILAFAAEQLRARRAHRLQVEQERTRQALIGHDRDALVWNQLSGTADASDQAPERR